MTGRRSKACSHSHSCTCSNGTIRAGHWDQGPVPTHQAWSSCIFNHTDLYLCILFSAPVLTPDEIFYGRSLANRFKAIQSWFGKAVTPVLAVEDDNISQKDSEMIKFEAPACRVTVLQVTFAFKTPRRFDITLNYTIRFQCSTGNLLGNLWMDTTVQYRWLLFLQVNIPFVSYFFSAPIECLFRDLEHSPLLSICTSSLLMYHRD